MTTVSLSGNRLTTLFTQVNFLEEHNYYPGNSGEINTSDLMVFIRSVRGHPQGSGFSVRVLAQGQQLIN